MADNKENKMFDCNICADEKATKEKVTCPCGFDACKECVKQYLLSRLEDAHCMSCKTGWGMKFLIDSFGKSWAEGNKEGGWRHYRKKVALDREKARLPETLAELPKVRARETAFEEAEKLCKQLQRERYLIAVQMKELKQLQGPKSPIVPKPYTKSMDGFPTGHGITVDKAKNLLGYRKCKIPKGYYVRTTNAKTPLLKPNRSHRMWVTYGIYIGPKKHEPAIMWIAKKAGMPKRNTSFDVFSELRQRYDELGRLMLDAKVQARNAKGRDDPALSSPNFLCPCPQPDCNGMIESKGFTCVKCEKKVCRRCREPKPQSSDSKDKKHKCNEDVLENLKFLKVDTKPCPTCATPIHKISGCDQMWCSQCKTAFSWITGKIEVGTIHNPHAIQWRRENGTQQRDINDVPCGGLVPPEMIDIKKCKNREKVFRMYQVVGEIDAKIDEPDNDFSDLRMSYVKDEIDEKKWQQSIFLRERENARRKANNDILVTFRTLAVERFRDLAENVKEQKSRLVKQDIINKFIEEMEKIRIFINKAFEDELPPLGNKKHLYIVNFKGKEWMWNREYEKMKKRMAADPNYKE